MYPIVAKVKQESRISLQKKIIINLKMNTYWLIMKVFILTVVYAVVMTPCRCAMFIDHR